VSWWLTPAPPERLACLRLSIGGFALVYLAIRAANLVSVADFAPAQFEPVGLASLLAAPLPGWLVKLSVALAVAAGLCFTLGLLFEVTGLLFGVLLLWVTTYRSSWGMVFHTENLLTLHVLLLALAPAADVLSLDARRRAAVMPTADAAYGWAIRALSLVTVIAYVLAGVAKLKLAGGPWLEGELLRTQIAYDNLRKIELGTTVSPLGPWLVRHQAVFAPLAVLTMFVELGAPLALVHRRIAWGWVLAAWGFHVGVLLLMSIGFVYQLTGIAYLPFFPIERVLGRLKRRRS
jgi:hypothetical protein